MMDAIRWFDFAFSIVALIILFPFFVLLALFIKLSSNGPVFFRQSRVGKGGKEFKLYKFRSMYVNAHEKGLLTVGGKDNRITAIGFYLRKYKLDELPQLVNVLKGEMSIVGPRPEVKKYVDLYTEAQRRVLEVRPGITDNASIVFRNENDLLATAADAEEFYINVVMPKKIELNYEFINNRSIQQYFKIIIKTIRTSLR
jgi:lipopolysaccharide/colanic/teichoic acid biosynthesis glycosyltransferase